MEIDYSAVKPADTEVQKPWNKAPRHVYFGPKDPNTGEMLPEPAHAYAKFPHFYYRKNGDGIAAMIVESEDEANALPEGWTPRIGDLTITCPSWEQAQAMRLEAEREAMRLDAVDNPDEETEVAPPRRKPGRPRKE